MRIRIGDRVRLKLEQVWGTVVRRHDWGHDYKITMYLIRLDLGLYLDRTKRQIEKLPRYRGIPQARDMATAHRHLQERMK